MGIYRELAALLLLALLFPIRVDGETLKVPSDFPTIQQAIDESKEGDTILVSPGTYREHLELKPGITVKSSGDDSKGTIGLKRAEATILDGTGLDESKPGVRMAEKSVLDGVSVTGIGTYRDDLWQKHHATQGKEQSYEHIGAPGVAGITVDGIAYCLVTNNIVHHIGYTGIAISGAKEKEVSPHIYRNICYRNMGGGIGAMNGSTAIIKENICFENFYAGIGHENAHPLVEKNICYANIRAGIGISEDSCPLVRGNKCYQNRRAGIGIRTGSDTKPIVEDNDCYQNDMAGIGTDDGAAPIIRGNRCYENALAGIGTKDDSSPVITGNKCYNNKLSGIGSSDESRPSIIGNECFGNETAGISQRGDVRCVILNNYSHQNKKAGITFDTSKSGAAVVSNNRVINNPLVAIAVGSGWKVDISGNEFSREEGMPPLAMVFQGGEAVFSNNVFRCDGVAGLRAAGSVKASGNRFEASKLRKVGPPSYAIWALKGSDISMDGNLIKNFRNALNATECSIDVRNNEVYQSSNVAFVISSPLKPANVTDNVLHSDDADAKVYTLKGDEGGISGNRIQKIQKKPASEAK